MSSHSTNPNFMNGVPELLILGLLQHQEMYGYQIVQEIHARTGAAVVLGEGVVYPVLHALEHDGALIAHRKTVNGRSRIYYAATHAGSHRFAQLFQSWADLTSAVQTMLPGGNHGEAFS